MRYPVTPTHNLYPANTASGVPWLDDVPEHWDLVQLGRIGKFSKGNGGTKDDEVSEGIPCIRYGDIYTSHKYQIQATRSFVTQTKAAEYTPILYGDILFAGSGETIAEIGKAVVNLIQAPVCCGGDVVLFRPDVEMDARFSGYAIDCPQAQYQKSCMGRGITVMHIYGDELKYLWVALPPLAEQRAIVRYLDHVDRRIRRYVSAKRRLIALLEEERQAVVNRAVTRGLDPNVRLKPSGVEWLGDVPEHWEVRRLRESNVHVIGGVWGDEPTGEDDIVCVRVADFDRLILRARTDNPTMRQVTNAHFARRRLISGDLLLEKSGGGDNQPVGVVTLFEGDMPAVCSNFIARVCIAEGFSSEFLLALHSTLYSMRVNVRSIKQTTGIQNLDVAAYFNEEVAFPLLAEQSAIVEYLDSATADIDADIARARRQIELLQEYRTRLIADVVTGKLDVREATAQLSGDDLLPSERHSDPTCPHSQT